MQDLPAIPDAQTAPVPLSKKYDDLVIDTWLRTKAEKSAVSYSIDIKQFREYLSGKPLGLVTTADILNWSDSLKLSLKQRSVNRKVCAVKSLLSFAQRTGYLRFDVGSPIPVRRVKDTLSSRILKPTEVWRMIGMAGDPRDRMVVYLSYLSGGRVSEIAKLTWRDFDEREKTGQVTLFGKGNKTRTILLPEQAWEELMQYRESVPHGLDDPVLPSKRTGENMTTRQLMRIVREAAKRAGIDKPISPHWLRHAHASHALEQGCPIHLVQTTLGHESLETTQQYLHARPDDSSARYLGV